MCHSDALSRSGVWLSDLLLIAICPQLLTQAASASFPSLGIQFASTQGRQPAEDWISLIAVATAALS